MIKPSKIEVHAAIEQLLQSPVEWSANAAGVIIAFGDQLPVLNGSQSTTFTKNEEGIVEKTESRAEENKEGIGNYKLYKHDVGVLFFHRRIPMDAVTRIAQNANAILTTMYFLFYDPKTYESLAYGLLEDKFFFRLPFFGTVFRITPKFFYKKDGGRLRVSGFFIQKQKKRGGDQ